MKRPLIIFVLSTIALWPMISHASRSSRTEAFPIGEPTEITSPGAYKLANSITGQIIISSDNVSLDLNNYAITGDEGSAILVSATCEHIEIQNGNIESITSGAGVDVSAGCIDISIRNLHLHQCEHGIRAIMSGSLVINECVIVGSAEDGIRLEQCSLCVMIATCPLQCTIGMHFINTVGVHMWECGSVGHSKAGFYLSGSSRCAFKGCTAIQTGSGSITDSYAFFLENGQHNQLINCIAEGTSTTATDTDSIAAGICLKGTEHSAEILQCSVSNSQTPADQLAKAYGIVLLESFSSLDSIMSESRGAAINSLAWYPDARFIAIAGPTVSSNSQLEIYEFDPDPLSSVLRDSVSHGATLNSVAWSQDSKYLAAAGLTGTDSKEIRLYSFSEHYKMLKLCDSATHGATVNGIAFSPNSRFLAIGGATSGTYQLRLFELDHDAKTLTLISSVEHGAEIKSLTWSPSGQFLLVGGAATGGNEIALYELSLFSKTLTLRDNLVHGATINTVSWSACEPYIAAGGAVNGSGYDTLFIEFDATAKTLTTRDSKAHGAAVNDISWSQKNYFITAGATASDDQEARVYLVNPVTKTLSLEASSQHGAALNTASWSVPGTHVAVGGTVSTDISHRTFTALQAPKKCTVSNNLVHNVHGCLYKMSTGISAPGLTNLISENRVYDCDKNYMYATNVYDGSINGNPGRMQNISA